MVSILIIMLQLIVPQNAVTKVSFSSKQEIQRGLKRSCYQYVPMTFKLNTQKKWRCFFLKKRKLNTSLKLPSVTNPIVWRRWCCFSVSLIFFEQFCCFKTLSHLYVFLFFLLGFFSRVKVLHLLFRLYINFSLVYEYV